MRAAGADMKAVLDANVIVSALISSRGAPRQIIDQWRARTFELLTSEAILEEVGRVLRYPKIAALHHLSKPELIEFLTLLREESHIVVTTETFAVSPDETDNRYLECAVTGGAEYLVSGDKRHLLPLVAYRGVRVVSPTTFLIVLQLEQ